MKIGRRTYVLLVALCCIWLVSMVPVYAVETLSADQAGGASARVAPQTRVTITTVGSGVTNVRHIQKTDPPEIELKFLSKNVVSAIPEDVEVNRGVISSINASYYGSAPKAGDEPKALKSLVFHLVAPTSYKIDTIETAVILTIDNPVSGGTMPAGGIEISSLSDARITDIAEKNQALIAALEKAESLFSASPIVAAPTDLAAKISDILTPKTVSEDVADAVKVRDMITTDQPATSAMVAAAGYMPPSFARARFGGEANISEILDMRAAYSRGWFVVFFSLLALTLGFSAGALMWNWQKQKRFQEKQRSQALSFMIEDVKTEMLNAKERLAQETMRCAQLEEALSKKNDAIEEKLRHMRELESTIDVMHATISAKNKMIHKITEERRVLEGKVDETLSSREALLRQRQLELDQLRREYQDLHEELTAKDALLKELKVESEENFAAEGLSFSELTGEDEVSGDNIPIYSGPERRIFSRVDMGQAGHEAVFKGLGSDDGGMPIEIPVDNLSAGGLSFACDKNNSLPETLPANLYVSGLNEPIEVLTKTVWQKDCAQDADKTAYGLAFEAIDDRQQLMLDQYIDEVCKELLQEDVVVAEENDVTGDDEVLFTPDPSKKMRTIYFELFSPEAQEVFLVGEFNNWQPVGMDVDEDGWWQSTLKIAPGKYQYGFMVDGNWQADPDCGRKAETPFGTHNSILEVAEYYGADIVGFRIYEPDAKEVFISGDFNNWNTESHPMKKRHTGWWKVHLLLTSGRYAYKFFVDGNWREDLHCSLKETNFFGGQNCIIEVD